MYKNSHFEDIMEVENFSDSNMYKIFRTKYKKKY